MRIDTPLSVTTASADTRPAAAEAERAGYAGVWTSEVRHDPFIAVQGKWQQMGTLIDDQVLDAFAVTAEPGQVAPELLRRYGDVMTRMTLYTPYPIDVAVARQIAADLLERHTGLEAVQTDSP